MTEIKAEVPMAEMLTYAPDLRSITGGQGEYTIEFFRYEEVPAQLAQKVAEQAEEVHAVNSGLARPNAVPSGRHRPVGRGRYPHGPPMARTRDIKTNQQDISCDVCGRTLLRGSGPSRSSRAASAATSASCAPRAPSTRAGSASPAPTS